MLADIEADAIFGMVDLVITGHFSLPEQGGDRRRRARPVREASERPPVMVVDPILGDAPGGLYVRPEVAEAVAQRLGPARRLADAQSLGAGSPDRRPDRGPGRRHRGGAAAGQAGRDHLGAGGRRRDRRALRRRRDWPPSSRTPSSPRRPTAQGDLVTASFGAGLVEGLAADRRR
jgi:pyridoxine kinase